MIRRLSLLSLGVMLIGATSAQADEAVPNARTPDGPATVSSVWRGASTMEGLGPRVLTAVRITVGPGGNAGPIRLRVSSSLDREQGTQLGPWVDLPAEPGTYTFPAPALHWDYRSAVIAIDQQVGGHAIVRSSPCTPNQGEMADLCQIVALAVFHGLADTDPAIGTATSPDERHPGEQLTVTGVTERDSDGDRVPDTEDRTDLSVTATRAFAADGTVVLRATVRNAGPLASDRPFLLTDVVKPGVVAWEPVCRSAFDPAYSGTFAFPPFPEPGSGLPPDGFLIANMCLLDPLPAGASRTVVARLPASSDSAPITLQVSGDGDDVNAADNRVVVDPPAVVELRPAAARRIARGIKVVVTARRAGRLQVTARVGGHRSTASARFTAAGRKTVVLRPHLHKTWARTAMLRATFTGRDGAVSRATQQVGIRPSR